MTTLGSPESHAQTTIPVSGSHLPATPETVSAAVTAGYRGMLRPSGNVLYSGSPDIEIWSMDLIKSLSHMGWLKDDLTPETVGDILPGIVRQVTEWPEYRYLINSFAVFGQQVPVRVFKELPGVVPVWFRDGIHRVAIADYLGWDSMLVTTGVTEKSMWNQWDTSADGIKFHDLKAKRMGIVSP